MKVAYLLSSTEYNKKAKLCYGTMYVIRQKNDCVIDLLYSQHETHYKTNCLGKHPFITSVCKFIEVGKELEIAKKNPSTSNSSSSKL